MTHRVRIEQFDVIDHRAIIGRIAVSHSGSLVGATFAELSIFSVGVVRGVVVLLCWIWMAVAVAGAGV